ncbi:MAG: DUF1501 domain-containing protein [Planctomycetes bacterium]|nr:DUF1501 domain-containing protein [Planctomycetota bacterium]
MLPELAVASHLPHRRRDFLRVGGGLACAGFGLPTWVAQAQGDTRDGGRGGRAKSCILVYLLGGPPHLDMFDLKPEAAAEIRGPFQPIATNVPGLDICEHLPRLAQMADQYTLLRSVSYPNSNHTPMIYYTLTGRPTERPDEDNDVRPPQRSDFPHLGCVLSKLQDRGGALPAYVALPEVATRNSTQGEFQRGARLPLRGGAAGFLGAKYDALNVNGEPGAVDAAPALMPPPEVTAERFERRAAFLELLNRPASATRDFDDVRHRAALLTGVARDSRQAPFTLAGERESLRARYGEHRFGRSLLMARRLVEAGVSLVAVHFNEMTVCDGWDTHTKNFEGLQTELLPMVDQGLSALIDDLKQRGMFDDTLILCFGEFGRTPKINANAGRDHWGPCSTTLVAGGGLRMGQVIGASDKIGAYPITDPIRPVDVHATMYHALGIDRHTLIYDHLNRPYEICTGQVIAPLV